MMTRNRFSGLFASLAGVLLLAASVVTAPLTVTAGELSICNACGYEYEGVTNRCAHCGVFIAVPPPPEATNKVDRNVFVYLDPAVVKSEIAAGIESMQSGDMLLASLLFRNAIALNLLTDPASPEKLEGTIAANLKDALSRMTPAATVDAAVEAAGRARSRLKRIEEGRRYLSIGECAWVPQEILPRLSTRQKALLIKATAPPCGTCMGLGRVLCNVCRGRRIEKCPEPKCEKGYVPVEVGGKLTRKAMTRKERCTTCSGRSEIRCRQCRGDGHVLCQACNGTGERRVCGECHGEGTVPCVRCGRMRQGESADCPDCGGEKAVICAACGGEGRRHERR